MKSIWLIGALVCLCSAEQLSAQQTNYFSQYVVSLYRLEHKTERQAQRAFEKGAGLLRQHAYQAGVEVLQKAVSIDPQYWDAENDLGYAFLMLDQSAKAEQAFQRAIEIDPENAVGYTNMGIVAAGIPDYSLAERAARKALSLNPTLPQAKVLLGVTAMAQGHWTDEAHRMLEQSAEQLPAAKRLLKLWPAHPNTERKIVVMTSAIP